MDKVSNQKKLIKSHFSSYHEKSATFDTDPALILALVNVEKYQEEPYTNLSLNNAAAEVLGISVDKLYQKGVNWKREPHDAHKLYATLDAVISLHLYQNLAPVLQADGASQGKAVPGDWYTFNSTMGETTRDANNYRAVPQLRNNFRGTEIRDNRYSNSANTKSEKRACLSATAAKTGWRVTYEVPSMRDEVEEG
ncbi:hypothetical protein DFH09DRAFT_1084757 [Mycena vulgaris]|nr:hypothetical protein DFH09DRAFT_1084757 [Mycena vulgaris]